MSCPTCDSSTIVFSVPPEYREYVQQASVASFCPHCLTLEAVDTKSAPDTDPAPDPDPDFARVSDAFPTTPDQAIPLAIALGLADSLATNRAAIETLLQDVEHAGADPLLAIDRLVTDPDIKPAIDLERRAHQLEQLLY